MSGNVVPLFSQDRNSTPGVRCGCRPGAVCYPHRLTNAADLARAELASQTDWLLRRSEVERITGDLLAVLDAIAAECLPDERTAR